MLVVAMMIGRFSGVWTGMHSTRVMRMDLSWGKSAPSADGEEVEDGMAGMLLAEADEYGPGQPVVRSGCGFERGREAEVIVGRIDRLSALDPRLHISWSMGETA